MLLGVVWFNLVTWSGTTCTFTHYHTTYIAHNATRVLYTSGACPVIGYGLDCMDVDPHVMLLRYVLLCEKVCVHVKYVYC